MQTKFYLTVFHRLLSCISTAIINWFIFIFKTDSVKFPLFCNVFEMIRFIIILFGELIYTEVIICKFMGLEENTKKEILKRISLETHSFDSMTETLEEMPNRESVNEDNEYF